ncbi:GTD2B protein, partial [Amia calva]|nr:GTD2B protein [Amia calva]
MNLVPAKLFWYEIYNNLWYQTSFSQISEGEMQELNPSAHVLHCIIHQESLYGKVAELDNVMSTVVKCAHFIRSQTLHYYQFRALLAVRSQYDDIQNFLQVRCLSCKGLDKPHWLMDLAFHVDLTEQIKHLNRKFQGPISAKLSDYVEATLDFQLNITDNMPQVNNQSSQTLREIKINEEEVLKGLAELKTNRSPGPDGIFPTVLKEIREIIYRPLTKIFQITLRTGDVVTDWKTTNVIPIHKKGDKTETGNQSRPISLTCITCKMLEKMRSILMKTIFLEIINMGLDEADHVLIIHWSLLNMQQQL